MSGVKFDEMRLRRFALGFVGVVAAALVAALPAAAKEGVKATLTTRIPLDAPAGTHLRVSWTLAYPADNGRRKPFGANGVFVQLRSASGAKAETGVTPSGGYTTGEYTATVAVPEGGIGDVEIGLRGFVDGVRPSDMLFPITNDPVPGSRIAIRAPRSETDGTGSTIWILILAGGSLLTIAALRSLRRTRVRPRRGV
jgi:hypothetical protein